MKTRLGFLSSCATRDIFRSPHNVKYSDEFEIIFQQQRVTLISLMQNPIPYTIDSTRRIENGEEKVFCSDWIRDDLSKSLFNELKKGVDYLLIDMFFDVFFGVLISGDKIVTNNHWDIPFTNFYSTLENQEILTMCNNHDKYFELWKQNCDKFFEYMKKEFPDTKIVLNKLRGATKVVRTDGSSYIAPSYVRRTEKLNIALEELEQYIINNHDVKVIDCLEYTITDEGHIWGRFFLHFIKDYYNLAYRQMKDILVQDKLEKVENLNSKVDYMSKQIELLSSENKKYISKIDVMSNQIELLSSENNSLIQENEILIRDYKESNNGNP